MAIYDSQPIPFHYPFENVSATTYDIREELGYFKAEITAAANWFLPDLSGIVRGSTLCIINNTAFTLTLHAAGSDIIQTNVGSASTLDVISQTGTQLTTEPGIWLQLSSLGPSRILNSLPGPGEEIFTYIAGVGTIKRLIAGTNIGFTFPTADTIQINNLLTNIVTTTTRTSIGISAGGALGVAVGSAFGYSALLNTTGANNVGAGDFALSWNTSGTDNTGVGSSVLGADPAATQLPGAYSNNSLLGNTPMSLMSAGSNNNVALGRNALRGRVGSVNTANFTIGMGQDSWLQCFTLNTSIAVGSGAASYVGNVLDTTVVGNQAYLCDSGNATTNSSNAAVAIGAGAYTQFIAGVVSSVQATAFGRSAMGATDNTSSSGTGVGYQSLNAQRAAAAVGVGYRTGKFNRSSFNAFVGYNVDSGVGNTTTDNCAVVGYRAAEMLQTTGNTVFGSMAGLTFAAGQNNVIIGYGTDTFVNPVGNNVIIGAFGINNATSQFVLGSAAAPLNTSLTVGAGGGASALPATPVRYLRFLLNGTLLRLPLFNP